MPMSDDRLHPDLQGLVDPWLRPGDKAFPLHSPPLRRSAIGRQGWDVLRGDLPFPVAVVRRTALDANLAWMQEFVRGRGAELAPHGKTTMSPQLFQRQLDAGAWGLTVANTVQLLTAVQAGARRCLVANQVLDAGDLRAIAELCTQHAGLDVLFLVDSFAQVELVEQHAEGACFDVLLELGVSGGRTGLRDAEEAIALARRIHHSRALRLRGLECYEGLGMRGDDAADAASLARLMDSVGRVASACAASGWFAPGAVVLTAGGSAAFDLVADALNGVLAGQADVVRVLRSGCYLTSDDGLYARYGHAIGRRLGCAAPLQSALEVWATVQSRPEPGLAIVGAGKRDLSHDAGMPCPLRWCPAGSTEPRAADPAWHVDALNDQHAYLRLGQGTAPQVGDRVALGISHPCTTFDKWRWMPIVDDRCRVVDALTTCF
jgi:D-serine dehydratase